MNKADTDTLVRTQEDSQDIEALFQPSKLETQQNDSVVIIGLGYVGLPLAILAASNDFHVVGFDIDQKKIDQLLKREPPTFITKEEQDILSELPNLRVTANEEDIWHAKNYIICVPTPVKSDHMPDFEPLKSAARIVGRHLTKGALVVIESTVNPGACDDIVLPILEHESGLVGEHEFFFAHCPERINPGDKEWNVETIPRVVGGLGPKSLARALELYEKLLTAEIVAMPSIKEAEAVKMVENSFRDVNIAFVNELAMAFDRAGIDLVSVIKGASSKPFSFIPHFPGCGVGGHCIPVDPYYLIRYGEKNGFEHRFLMTARRINNNMPKYTVRRLARALREKRKFLNKTRVALLGLTYKKDVPDLRESPALEIEHHLRAKGAIVKTYDPFVPESSSAKNIDDALRGCTAVIIATDHSAFQELTPRDFANAGISIVIDGRNCLSKDGFEENGITYRGIGH